MKVKFLKAILDGMCPEGDVYFKIDERFLKSYGEAIVVNTNDLDMLTRDSILYDEIGFDEDESLWINLRPLERNTVSERSDEFHRKYKLKDNQQ